MLRIAQNAARAARLLLRRLDALRFLPVSAAWVATRLEDAGYRPGDDPEGSVDRPRHAADRIWTAASIGTPPHRAFTLDLDGFDRLAQVRSWDRRPVARLLSSLVAAHVATHRACLGDSDFWARALRSVRRVGLPYLVIGDSHSLCSCVVGGSVRRPTVPIHVLCTAGSASGLDNPASRSGYAKELTRLADALRACDAAAAFPILFQFGQVDVEFVSVFHRIARSETRFDRARFEAFCDKAVEAYASFLTASFWNIGAVHVLSIFPPALADSAWADGYTNAHVAQLEGDRDADEIGTLIRSIEIPSLTERTALHRSFNARLDAMCRTHNLTFVDLFDRFIGRGGTIATRFNRFSRGRDHHLTLEAARKVIRPVVARLARSPHEHAAGPLSSVSTKT